MRVPIRWCHCYADARGKISRVSIKTNTTANNESQRDAERDDQPGMRMRDIADTITKQTQQKCVTLNETIEFGTVQTLSFYNMQICLPACEQTTKRRRLVSIKGANSSTSAHIHIHTHTSTHIHTHISIPTWCLWYGNWAIVCVWSSCMKIAAISFRSGYTYTIRTHNYAKSHTP